jgi:hypothetical protein
MLHQFLDERETRRQPINLLVQLSQDGEMRSKFDINKPAKLRQILGLVPGKVVFNYEDAGSDTVEVPKIPRPNRSRIHQDQLASRVFGGETPSSFPTIAQATELLIDRRHIQKARFCFCFIPTGS